jgi:hypothetical protein
LKSSVPALRASSMRPRAETKSVGGTLILTPPIIESFFIESFPETSGVP